MQFNQENIMQIREYIQKVVRREDRIRELGGVIPGRWPWDQQGDLRASQLLEVIEDLEAKAE